MFPACKCHEDCIVLMNVLNMEELFLSGGIFDDGTYGKIYGKGSGNCALVYPKHCMFKINNVNIV